MEDKYTNENGIRELLIKIRTWVNSEKTIALKKVIYNNNSLMFYKNPNATDADEPEYKIDLPVEKFLEQTKTTLVQEFAWNEDEYPGTENPNLDGNPVLDLSNGDMLLAERSEHCTLMVDMGRKSFYELAFEKLT